MSLADKVRDFFDWLQGRKMWRPDDEDPPEDWVDIIEEMDPSDLKPPDDNSLRGL